MEQVKPDPVTVRIAQGLIRLMRDIAKEQRRLAVQAVVAKETRTR